MANPIPVKHRAAFLKYMRDRDRNIDDDQQEWDLLNTAEEFMIEKKLQRGSPYDALLQYHKLRVDADGI
jgi:hypothetical protein